MGIYRIFKLTVSLPVLLMVMSAMPHAQRGGGPREREVRSEREARERTASERQTRETREVKEREIREVRDREPAMAKVAEKVAQKVAEKAVQKAAEKGVEKAVPDIAPRIADDKQEQRHHEQAIKENMAKCGKRICGA